MPADYFVFGHRHLPIKHVLKNGTSRYINLGDWLFDYAYAVFDGQNMELQFLKMVQEKYSAIRTLQISLLSLSCLIAYVKVGFAQPSDVVSSLQGMIPGKYAYFTTDKLKRIYAVNAANELIQFDSNGKELFRYNNNTLGELTYIDTANPFNLLLFYPEFQTIVTLDRTLNPIAELNLLTTEVGDASAVALSNDNQLWGIRCRQLATEETQCKRRSIAE